MADDKELADLRADREEPEYKERLSRWSPEVSMLAAIIDRLGSVLNAVVVTNGGKAIRIPTVPRPVTEVELARTRVRRERSDAFLLRMESPD